MMNLIHPERSRVRYYVRAWLAVVGGTLVHLTLGTLYTFGNITPYVTSYVRNRGTPSSLRYGESVWIYALAITGQGAAMFVGGIISNRLGTRWTTLLGGWMMSAGVILTTWTIQVSFYLAIMTYGLLFGFGIGVAYAPPMACAMKWLPDHKGLVNGIVVAGFGGGAFIFDQVQTAFINPNNKAPTKPLEPGSTEKYFSDPKDSALLDSVPHCFLLLGACYAVMQLVGCLLLGDPAEELVVKHGERTVLVKTDSVGSRDGNTSSEEEEDSTQRTVGSCHSMYPTEVLKTRAFYTLWAMFLFNGQAILFVSTLYKTYAQTFIKDDRFLALVGAFASVFNSLGRILWGHLADRFSFRVIMICVCSIMVALLLTLVITPMAGQAMLFIWVCLLFGTFCGNFSLFPTATAKAFGPKYVATNYGLVFTSQAVTAPIAALLSMQLSDSLGWFGMFSLTAAFTFVGGILAFSFNVKTRNGNDI